MTTTIDPNGPAVLSEISLQYSHSIGRAEFSGPGFRNPTAMARGEEDVMYVANRSYDYRPDGKRITMCTGGRGVHQRVRQGRFRAGRWRFRVHGRGHHLAHRDHRGSQRQRVPGGRVPGPYQHLLARMANTSPSGSGRATATASGTSPADWSSDANGTLYLVDCNNHRVQMLTADGEYIGKWGELGRRPRPVQHALRRRGGCRDGQRLRCRLAQ